MKITNNISHSVILSTNLESKTMVEQNLEQNNEQSYDIQDNVEISDEGIQKLRESLKESNSNQYINNNLAINEIEPDSIGDSLWREGFESKFSEALNGIKEKSGTYGFSDIMGAAITAYGSMYNEIVEGYANGTREIWVADDELGRRKLTKDEELEYLDSVYDKETEWQQMVAESRETTELGKKIHLPEAIRKSLGYSENIDSMEEPYVKQNLTETVSNVMYEMRNIFLELYQSGEKIDFGNLSNSVLNNYGDFEEKIEKIF